MNNYNGYYCLYESIINYILFCKDNNLNKHKHFNKSNNHFIFIISNNTDYLHDLNYTIKTINTLLDIIQVDKYNSVTFCLNNKIKEDSQKEIIEKLVSLDYNNNSIYFFDIKNKMFELLKQILYSLKIDEKDDYISIFLLGKSIKGMFILDEFDELHNIELFDKKQLIQLYYDKLIMYSDIRSIINDYINRNTFSNYVVKDEDKNINNAKNIMFLLICDFDNSDTWIEENKISHDYKSIFIQGISNIDKINLYKPCTLINKIINCNTNNYSNEFNIQDNNSFCDIYSKYYNYNYTGISEFSRYIFRINLFDNYTSKYNNKTRFNVVFNNKQYIYNLLNDYCFFIFIDKNLLLDKNKSADTINVSTSIYMEFMDQNNNLYNKNFLYNQVPFYIGDISINNYNNITDNNNIILNIEIAGFGLKINYNIKNIDNINSSQILSNFIQSIYIGHFEDNCYNGYGSELIAYSKSELNNNYINIIDNNFFKKYIYNNSKNHNDDIILFAVLYEGFYNNNLKNGNFNIYGNVSKIEAKYVKGYIQSNINIIFNAGGFYEGIVNYESELTKNFDFNINNNLIYLIPNKYGKLFDFDFGQYTGYFLNGNMNGIGELIYTSGTKVCCNFLDNYIVGERYIEFYMNDYIDQEFKKFVDINLNATIEINNYKYNIASVFCKDFKDCKFQNYCFIFKKHCLDLKKNFEISSNLDVNKKSAYKKTYCHKINNMFEIIACFNNNTKDVDFYFSNNIIDNYSEIIVYNSKVYNNVLKINNFIELSNVTVHITYKNSKDIYIGQLFNGYRQGKGYYYNTSKNTIYIGNYLKNRKSGYGILKNNKKFYIYKGNFKKGKFYGKGIIQYNNGDKLLGYFKEGKLEGEAWYIYKNGNILILMYKRNMLLFNRVVFYEKFDDNQYSNKIVLNNINKSLLL